VNEHRRVNQRFVERRVSRLVISIVFADDMVLEVWNEHSDERKTTVKQTMPYLTAARERSVTSGEVTV